MDTTTLHNADAVVNTLARQLKFGLDSVHSIPALVKKIIKEDLWRSRVVHATGEEVHFDSFAEFVTKPRPDGLNTSVDMLDRICKEDAEALRMLREATTRPNHRPKAEETNDNIISSEQGTGRSYTLDRLYREREDLYEKVVEGELSANAAAIEAGFRTKTITVPLDVERAAKSLRKHFGDDLPKLVEALS